VIAADHHEQLVLAYVLGRGGERGAVAQLPIRGGDDLDPRVQASGGRHLVGVVTDDHEDPLEPKRK
jgi:hypothetical protein